MSQDSDYFFRQMGRSYWLSNLRTGIWLTFWAVFWFAFAVILTLAIINWAAVADYIYRASAPVPTHSRLHKRGVSHP